MNTDFQLLELFEERTQMLTFLSQVFLRELTLEEIETLLAADWNVPEGANEQIKQGFSLVKHYSAFAGTDQRTQLAVEYARIFLAAGVYTEHRQIAAPYESVFTSAEHLMMQESRDDVFRTYLQDGFMINRSLHEQEDHLGFELEYLAHLSRKATAAVLSGDCLQLSELSRRSEEFISAHLLNWLPALRDTAKRYAECTFYIGMLLICEGYLLADLNFLASIRDNASALAV